MKNILKYILLIIALAVLLVAGWFICFLAKNGMFYDPDMPKLQAEGEMLVQAIRSYEKIHGRLPENKYEFLADDKNIAFKARNLLLNLKWEYTKRSTPP